MAVEIDHACPSRARRPAGRPARACRGAAGPLVLEEWACRLETRTAQKQNYHF